MQFPWGPASARLKFGEQRWILPCVVAKKGLTQYAAQRPLTGAHSCGGLRPEALGPARTARNTVKRRERSVYGPKNRPHRSSERVLGPCEIHVFAIQIPIDPIQTHDAILPIWSLTSQTGRKGDDRGPVTIGSCSGCPADRAGVSVMTLASTVHEGSLKSS